MSRLQILVGGALAAVVLTVAGSLVLDSTASADPGKNCVGAAVSQTAQFYAHDGEPGGFGTAAHELGVNPGEAIQAYATANCNKHQ